MSALSRLEGFPGQQGYALLAALIVVAIVALSTAVALQSSRQAAQRERERELLFVGEQIRNAITRYNAVRTAGGAQEFPKVLEDLLEDPRQLVTVRHLRQIYRDPMTGERDWVLETVSGRIVGVHSSSDRTPLIRYGFAQNEREFEAARTYGDWHFSAVAIDSSNAPATAAFASMPNSAPALAADPGAPPIGPSQSPALTNAQVFTANQCFQEFVAPQGDCADEPPPFGRDQYTCIQHYQALYNGCMASGSPGP